MVSSGSNNNGALENARKLMTLAASVTTTVMVARSVINDFLPQQAQDFIYSRIYNLFNRRTDPDNMTIVVEEQNNERQYNEAYKDVELYLDKMVSSTNKSLKAWKEEDESLTVKMDKGGEVVDVFEGVELRWSFDARQHAGKKDVNVEDSLMYLLTFDQNHRDMVIHRYLPHVVEKAKAIREGETDIRVLMQIGCNWDDVVIKHPATFDTVALNPDMKQMLISDLDRFVKRKDYYRRIGKPWKRGYLFYGPSGTGKSSLIAAIANYLKFNIYDLDLTNFYDNEQLVRTILLQTYSKAIIVVEDIDCGIDIHNRKTEDKAPTRNNSRVSLSGLLNAFDGLLTSCDDQRIFIFTTNHKDKLDPALLRPGRMDLHLHLSYCTPPMFRVLVKNSHSTDDHFMFSKIESLMVEVEVTPAEVSGELLRSEDVEVALGYVETLLLEKSKEREIEIDDEELKSDNTDIG